jgi:hypothetical protein
MLGKKSSSNYRLAKIGNDYEAHHVELIMNENNFPRLFDSTGTLLNDVEAEQCTEILDVLHNLS